MSAPQQTCVFYRAVVSGSAMRKLLATPGNLHLIKGDEDISCWHDALHGIKQSLV